MYIPFLIYEIPYDMIHNIYEQELVRAKGLKEWQTLLSFFNNNYNSADIQACYLAKKRLIILQSSWITSETHHE